MSVNFDTINNVMQKRFNEQATDLEKAMKNVDLSKPEGMFEMQRQMQKWSMSIQMNATMIKEMGDALKGVIQKM